MARSDMNDLEWEFIKAVLPNKSRSVKRVDGRRVINGIFYVLRTGIPWADLPEQYGPPTTLKKRPAVVARGARAVGQGRKFMHLPIRTACRSGMS